MYVQWFLVKDHVGNTGIETTDRLAKQGAAMPDVLVPAQLSQRSVKSAVRQEFLKADASSGYSQKYHRVAPGALR